MWSVKSRQFICILHFDILCLTAIRIMFGNIWQCVYWGGYCGLSKSGLCVIGKLCPVCFLVFCKCFSVLLQSIVMSYADCGYDG